MKHHAALTRRATSSELAAVYLPCHGALSRSLASHAADLLQAVSRGDEDAAERCRTALTLWCRQDLEPALEEALSAADRMVAGGDPDTGAAIMARVGTARSTIRDLDCALAISDVAVEVIHLRLHLYHLRQVLEAPAAIAA